MLQNKISWIYFKSSFGVSNKSYTREDLNSLIKNLTNDNEILKLFIQNEVETSNMNSVNSNKENYEINDKLKYLYQIFNCNAPSSDSYSEVKQKITLGQN